MIRCREDGAGVSFRVRVTPGARRPGLRGEQDGSLKVAVSPAAEKGKANRALAELLADLLGVGRSQVTILQGEHRRDKVVRVTGITAGALHALVAERSTAG
jgi:uncharacterized protein (TIGR00251 family)